MTATSLLSAVLIGLVLGASAGRFVPACRSVPFWLPVAVGVGAAVLGTVVARLAGVDDSRVSPVELALQVSLAGLSMIVVALTADPRRPNRGHNETGNLR
ncbi:hypothetical protein GCM10020358_60530 [Amorphoplanes nipponensis]|uniref:Transglycosylase associated protein n=1 Tax=Actinoplanes nipponensis TaxID=135950 RepID=A0A919MF74_9ACTN|nr:GlsB/YeaQ/YmgE family stress response membrane protein [Actinoplanes nipponensis]GIE47224.1 hypothetical protein Ani05nite_07580 [Actinoplanes nipponensis]